MRKFLPKSRQTIDPSPCFHRRRFLRTSLALAGGIIAAPAVATVRRTGERRIELLNLHTGEKAKILYWSGGMYQPGGLNDLNHLLRDHRTGDVYDMDTGLFDLVHDLGLEFGSQQKFEIISGYRSPKTNKSLSNKSSGVAKRSLHMQGKAMDLRMPGVSLDKLKQTAMNLQRGGVGFYPKSGFIHVDTGRVRSW
ncbi:DUF882 domain-containing protein [Solemya velesiana gill symbiont]|uniref:Murein endopeptidase K n=1 Tax=Solemya velesiana gill symbiont TaxID=1918948 RepID=A0A1T2KXM8_9GAMM|nr:DUF882 domain-containing protein [Solemya velesiana gill symbiont]OOZ37582.1 hypothetical protein BOW51_01860 [Solemya velesiana gill symbiont]